MSILTEIEDNSSSYLERINYLKSEWDQDDVKKLQSGVNESLKNIKNGAKSFVVYGEPQSGKTEFMIALVCKLLDEKYETIFIIMNDNTELEYQNYDRFLQCKEMSASPKSAYEISNMEPSELKAGYKELFFVGRIANTKPFSCLQIYER